MKRYYYKKIKHKKRKDSHFQSTVHLSGVLLASIGVGILFYFSVPLMLWKVVFLPAFTTITSPIPDPFIFKPEKVNASKKEIKKIVLAAEDKITEDKTPTNKKDWFLTYPLKRATAPAISSYLITIPKLGITDATVGTQDSDLSKHLVQYYGTPVPPFKGNTIIFGHSTLPYLFDPSNYNTIFANAHTLKEGDIFSITVGKKQYNYEIIKMYITTPDDVSVLEQDSSDSYITIITCTPPGTVWQRLIIKSRLIQ
jgi:sortase A